MESLARNTRVTRQLMLSPEDLAEYVGVPLTTVYKWNSEGTSPVRIRCGKHIRYRWSDVERWLQEQAVDQGNVPTRGPGTRGRQPRRNGTGEVDPA